MQRVRLTCAVKHDAPLIVGDTGDILTLSDAVAVFAVNNKFGVYHGGPIDSPGPSRGQLEALEAEAQRGTLEPLKPSDEKVAEPPKRPYGNAPKSAWARYAAAVDPEMTVERAEDMTKADLMSKYGSRLGDED
jgi:hypothetical protein